ncbi:MAG TPA: hypothetical protein DHV36_05720 [Desulfobacteraceae bacterium]|nr:hypothetical protein [Desulfobacteraceae bacterium]|tara:strand:+ start:2056 stop:3024 length:969 start_codon:yes stop_codon:yes gene_type:complete
MLESLDVMISLGVIFLVLSMAQKYVMSLIKRLLSTKAEVVSKEMKTFMGEKTSQFLESYVKHQAQHLNVFEKKRLGDGQRFRLLTAPEVKQVACELTRFLNSDAIEVLKKDLGMENRSDFAKDLDIVKKHLDSLQTKADTLFENTLRKIEDSYKSKMRAWTFFVAFALVIVMNASFFDIYNRISSNGALRGKLVNSTESIMDRFDTVEKEMAELDQAQIKNYTQEVQGVKTKIADLTQLIEENQTFFGWDKKKWDDLRGWKILNKVVGFLISALLMSFGAPFWHDYLSTFVNIRKVVARRSEQSQAAAPPAAVSTAPGGWLP